MVTCVSGPILALFDYHRWPYMPEGPHDDVNHDIHCNATAVFVVAQIAYLFPLI